MKVKVNRINTSCIPMSEAVTMPNVTMITSVVSEESLARDTHARDTHLDYKHTYTHFCLVYLNLKTISQVLLSDTMIEKL